MSSYFEAWHGSRYGECKFGENPAWFSFSRGVSAEYALEADQENHLPTLCRVRIGSEWGYGRDALFDALDLQNDEDLKSGFIACLKTRGVPEHFIPTIISSMLSYNFTAFDPNARFDQYSDLVSDCIQDIDDGYYIGWLEREVEGQEPNSFGLFNPEMTGVTVIEEIKLAPNTGRELEKIDDATYKDGEFIYKICEECGQLLEFDEEDDEWTYPCHCDFRENPMTTVSDFEEFTLMEMDFKELSDWEVYEYAKEYYPDSLTNPDKFLKEHPESAGYRYLHGRNFMFVGPKGRLLKVCAEHIAPIEDNIFDNLKLKGLSVAPEFSGFKIPLFVGYVQPWLMSQGRYEETVEYEDAFYEPDEDDIGEVFFQLRDGNHRTIATLLSGEPYAYVQVAANAYQDYREWVEAGRPDEWPGGTTVLKYLDENLI